MAKNITDFVRSCVDDFKHFVGIDSFPAFDVKSKEITIEKSLKQGFDPSPVSPLTCYFGRQSRPFRNFSPELGVTVLMRFRRI